MIARLPSAPKALEDESDGLVLVTCTSIPEGLERIPVAAHLRSEVLGVLLREIRRRRLHLNTRQH